MLAFRATREKAQLQRVTQLLHELQETLEAGLVPGQDRWNALKELHAPWGPLAAQSVEELRRQGGMLLPTLKRLRALAENHLADLNTARARAGQSLMQAMVCVVLVPLFGGALYLLLPGVDAAAWTWAAGCVVAAILAAAGALWLLSMAEDARWGGLPQDRRSWGLLAQCAGERFLALIRSGVPADLAWGRACELLAGEADTLAACWGHSVWVSSQERVNPGGSVGAIIEAGNGLRKSVQVSLMEGRPCTERAEAVLQALRQDLRAQVEAALTALPTRSLKPLFVCVAPALFGMLAFGLYLTWDYAVGGGLGGPLG